VSGEIAKEIAGVNVVSTQLSENSAQVNQNADELNRLAGQLNELVAPARCGQTPTERVGERALGSVSVAHLVLRLRPRG